MWDFVHFIWSEQHLFPLWQADTENSILWYIIYQKSANKTWSMYIRVGKTGSLGPCSRVIVYCRSVRILPVIHLGMYYVEAINGSILTLLQYTMTLFQGPKNPVVPTLIYIPSSKETFTRWMMFWVSWEALKLVPFWFLNSQLGGQIQYRVNFRASQKITLLVKVDLYKRNISLQYLPFPLDYSFW